MEFIDPLVRLNCPWCGQQMHYESTTVDAQFYFCFKHGRVALRANWQFTMIPNEVSHAPADAPRLQPRPTTIGRPPQRSTRRLAT